MAERSQDQHGYDNDGELILTGSANAYVATVARSISGYFQGLRISGKANHTNSGASTLQIFGPNSSTGLGAVAIRKNASAVLVSGDIISGQYYDFLYDATNGWFQLLNPSVAANATNATTLGGLPLSSSGDRWGVIPFVASDGNMDVGRRLHFHNTDADTSDFDVELTTNGTITDLFVTSQGGDNKRIVSLTNSTLAQGDVIYYDGTNFVRLAPGTSGQFLKTNGAAANPAWESVGPTVVAAQATTSGTAIDFTGLPANVSRITVNFNGVSLSGTNNLLVQIGDSGGIETTGYSSTSARGGTNTGNVTAGFVIILGVNTHTIYGQMILTKIDTNTWVESHSNRTLATEVVLGGGGKTLSAGPLDRVRITPSGADTFDTGSVNIIYD